MVGGGGGGIAEKKFQQCFLNQSSNWTPQSKIPGFAHAISSSGMFHYIDKTYT